MGANDVATEPTITIKMPPAFVRDCLECDCAVGSYENGKLTATDAELAELHNRAEHYASPHGPECLPPRLKASAKAVLKALAAAARASALAALNAETNEMVALTNQRHG